MSQPPDTVEHTFDTPEADTSELRSAVDALAGEDVFALTDEVLLGSIEELLDTQARSSSSLEWMS